MNKEEVRILISLLVILVAGVLLAIAGSWGGIRIGNVPVFAIGVGLAFLFQWLAFIPSYRYRTEKFYDLTGGITYTTVTILSVLLSGKTDLRSMLLLVIILIWASRLSLFLFFRIRKAGEDRRFRELKQSFWNFLRAWTLQGLWVAFTLAAALAVITSERIVGVDIFLFIGMVVWVIGFSIEVAADMQKSRFKQDPANAGKFIQSGLWAWSRHPNYFGEIVLWIGVAIIALPVLRGWQWITFISPVFVTLLLTRISGVPMLEKRADEKWGGQPDYEAYKANTPVLILSKPKQG